MYCTAWTFYGSVGLAANRGLEFLTIYLGPALVALLWPTVLRKLVRVAKEQRITTISDFVASRYGKSAPLGTLVAILVVCGMIPYIALPLKAVSVSFAMMIGGDSLLAGFDPALLVAAMLALFGILFGARNLDFTREQTGLMSAVAVESIVKLVAFLLVGGFVTWGLFDGFADIFSRIAEPSRVVEPPHPGDPPAASYARWAFTAPAYAAFARFAVFTKLVGSRISELPGWVTFWQPAGLFTVVDRNGDGIVQWADFVVRSTDFVVLSMPEVAGLPFVITGLVMAGGLAAALSTDDGLLLTIANAISHDLYYNVIDPRASLVKRLTITKVLLVVTAIISAYTATFRFAVIAELVAWAFSLAGASFFPALVMGIWWKRANKQGCGA